MIALPKAFLGDADDLDQFFGDCMMYFKAHSSYFLLPSHMIPFATSLFDGAAKVWWVHKRLEYWSTSSNDTTLARFQYPTWEEFLYSEKKMFELKMGNGPATTYFQELEVLASKAGRRNDTDARGLMGENIPQDYSQWKTRITNMYEECQKKWAFDQTVGMVCDSRHDNRPNQKGPSTTATSNKAGGVTSSSSAKPTSSSAPSGGQRDAGGRWLSCPGTTFGGQGAPMDIGQMCAKGLCFRCHKQGHLSKDCPEKKDFRDIRSVQVTNKPVTESKVEEVKEEGKATVTYSTFLVTSCLPTHSAIPAINTPALNVSCTTSTPVSESQNRYAVLSIDEYTDNDIDSPLKGSNDGSPARAETKAANPVGHEAESLSTLPLRKLGQTEAKCHTSSPRGETQPTKALDEKSPTIVTPIDTASLPRRTDGTWDKLKHTPCEVSPQAEQAAPTQRSPITTVDVESLPDGALENTARITEDPDNVAGATTFSFIIPSGTAPSTLSDASMPKVAGETGNSAFAVQAHPIVPIAVATEPGNTLQVQQIPKPDQKEHDEDHQACPSKTAGVANATATKKITAGKEAASTQAVNRGHSVSIIEVPNEDDDMAYQIWLAKERTPAIAKKGSEPSSDPPMKSNPSRWYKPFEVDWTLHAVCEARNDSAAHAALFVWMHRDRIPKLTEQLLATLRKGGERAREHLYELHEPPRYLRRRQSSSRDFTLDVQLNPCTGKQTLSTKGLLDTAVPIAVYNADGTRNQARDITKFVEFRMTIGNHSERIDFAVTDLGSKDLYLGHNWLKRHNPNPFPLPDADPDDRWDEELEDGDRILAVNMEEELVIRTVHHANDLAATANADKPKQSFEEMVPPDYRSFHDLFSKENFDKLPERKPWDHAIELVPNAKSTLDCKVYPLNRDEQEQLDKFLDKNLESGCIKESKSPFTSPFFFVKKKDSALRHVQDYRKLNEMTIKNRYPLPLISELIDKLQGAKYFTKLDIRWGYNNVRIKEGDEHKAAFRTNRGLFEPTVMFFRLTNSPATFQWMMNDIFKDLISEGKVTIYLDNILIFTKDLDEHQCIVQRVLQRLQENKLFLKAKKCEFEVLETEYLRVIISEGQVCMDPVKLAGIAEWPTPTKKKEL
ncbi:uncharacterized protein ARMOST_20009 [Armillaria ostoyae]|uniref:Reverse transcriptase domain-containing protein n=1 Tax=Armillaria ostoyae TaxID=47428 RepID=A0A284S644_ARMOS|nr:uncharacterized protein ARMOST_20009 [Armillaria ostoyae]